MFMKTNGKVNMSMIFVGAALVASRVGAHKGCPYKIERTNRECL